MKNKEKLERAGWTFRCPWGDDDGYEVYGRKELRIVYDPERDLALCSYVSRVFNSPLCTINETQFEIFCEPLNPTKDEKENDS
jgi:hypothetical protein